MCRAVGADGDIEVPISRAYGLDSDRNSGPFESQTPKAARSSRHLHVYVSVLQYEAVNVNSVSLPTVNSRRP